MPAVVHSPSLPFQAVLQSKKCSLGLSLGNITWAQLFLSLPETWSAPRNCCLRAPFFLWITLESIFLASVVQHSCSHTFKERADLNCGQDETLWLSWDPINGSPNETLWAFLDLSGLWSAASLWGGSLSETANFQVCYTWRITKQQQVLVWCPHSSRPDPSFVRKFKSLWSFSLISKGNFSQVPCLHWLFLSVYHACAHVQHLREMLLS